MFSLGFLCCICHSVQGRCIYHTVENAQAEYVPFFYVDHGVIVVLCPRMFSGEWTHVLCFKRINGTRPARCFRGPPFRLGSNSGLMRGL